MRKIKKLKNFSKNRYEDMSSFINNWVNDRYLLKVIFNPLIILHYLLPIGLKFLPESYVLKEKNKILALVSVLYEKCVQKKVEIVKLFLSEEAYYEASELINFVVSKYKKLGSVSILVKVDDFSNELIDMFVNKCGFSHISQEKLWKINHFIDSHFERKDFRMFRNSDANVLASLYNDSLLPHFRPLLSKSTKYFREPFFKGLTLMNEYKYMLEDKNKNIIASVIIQTYDNENFILEIIQSNCVELDINSVIAFATYQIKKRKKKFGLFIKTKQYRPIDYKYEKLFIQNNFKCVQNKLVLTNSSAKVLKDFEKDAKSTLVTEFCPNGVVSTKNVM